MVIKNKLRLFLSFMDKRLERVRVVAVTNTEFSPAIMGTVEGKDQLQKLLEAAGIDHLIRDGDVRTARKMTPEEIVGETAHDFQKDHDLPIKFINDEILSDAEREFKVPKSLDVFSSTVSTDAGLKRVQDWFKAKKS